MCWNFSETILLKEKSLLSALESPSPAFTAAVFAAPRLHIKDAIDRSV